MLHKPWEETTTHQLFKNHGQTATK